MKKLFVFNCPICKKETVAYEEHKLIDYGTSFESRTRAKCLNCQRGFIRLSKTEWQEEK